MARILLVYYPHSGQTRTVAQASATRCDVNVDVEQILDARPRRGCERGGKAARE